MRPEKPYFSIGEVAKMKDVTIKALRHYHEMGLLIPAYIDEATGYRYYSIEQFLYIDMIRFAINAGTSLKELNRLLKNAG
ncbi:MAG TPA: MerR family transcriptional regulator, partial [Clostridiales bacterium]|nr:MerR family transcriptional regulator [Clostridiales bacterium]